jgi:hypothetical protein
MLRAVVSSLSCVQLVTIAVATVSFAQDLSSNEFNAVVQACAQNADVIVSDDLMRSIHDTYFDVKARNAFNSVGVFLTRMPAPDRGNALKLFDCLSKYATPPSGSSSDPKIVPPSPLPTVTYKVCSGEYERACQEHEAYLYCYADVGAWAAARCTSSKVTRYSTYGGNKCGYSMDLVQCTGPK